MDLIEKIQNIASRVSKQKDLIQTEEATKNAFVLPFISALGYDVFDPTEVVPEFTADIGTKKGEKVDYAVIKDGKPILLFECKKVGDSLDENKMSQLYRYFSVTDARIGVLTDGVLYKFFADLEKPNQMDSKPFLELDILNIPEVLISELKKLTKDFFDIDKLIDSASELKYTKQIKNIMGEQIKNPSDDFVKFFASQVYSGVLTQKVRAQFSEIVQRSLVQFMNEKVSERLKSALNENENEINSFETNISEEHETTEEIPEDEKRVETTAEEMEGFFIVKSMLRKTVNPDRIFHRDTISYFGVLLDDNNRKPICRLHFNSGKKYIELFDENKTGKKYLINNLNDIYQYEQQLIKTPSYYDDKKEETTNE